MAVPALQYIADERGDITAVVVPVEVWRELSPETETQHILNSPAMRERLLAALSREGGVGLDDVLARLGVSKDEAPRTELRPSVGG